MGGNQLVTESQAHLTSGYRQALTDNGCCANEEEEEGFHIDLVFCHFAA